MTTTTGESLADLIVAQLQAAAAAGQFAGVPAASVFGVRAWPTQDDQMPQVQFTLPEEDKQSIGRSSAPQFTVTATLPVLISVQEPGAEDEAGAAAARASLADIGRAFERVVVGQPDLMRLIQRVAFIKVHGQVDAGGREIVGRRVILLGLEFYQGPEDFFVEVDPDLVGVDVTSTLADDS